jgi:hypothetical protein
MPIVALGHDRQGRGRCGRPRGRRCADRQARSGAARSAAIVTPSPAMAVDVTFSSRIDVNGTPMPVTRNGVT